MSELEIPTVVAWLVIAGIVAFFILLIWSMKRHRDPKLEVDCDAPIEELIQIPAGSRRQPHRRCVRWAALLAACSSPRT